jgi:hypothetical protein
MAGESKPHRVVYLHLETDVEVLHRGSWGIRFG